MKEDKSIWNNKMNDSLRIQESIVYTKGHAYKVVYCASYYCIVEKMKLNDHIFDETFHEFLW